MKLTTTNVYYIKQYRIDINDGDYSCLLTVHGNGDNEIISVSITSPLNNTLSEIMRQEIRDFATTFYKKLQKKGK